jgi:hypothetical protein
MSLKTAASRVGNALLDATTAMHNASIDSKINDLDEQAAALRMQLARIEEERSALEAGKI